MRVGFDLGTTNSCVAFFDGRAARMIELGEGVNTILPSVVTIAGDEVLIGQEAVEAGRRFPDYSFRNFKRKLAEKWHDEEDTGHQTCAGPDGMTHFAGPDGHTWSPADLTSYLIQTLVAAANVKLAPDDEVTGAVIGVPADFGQEQRSAVLEAAKLAGLTDVELIHEPTAAALAYGYDAKKARRIAVFDLGGGTFDISVISTGGGLVDVLATSGIRDLGGADWDRRIADYAINIWRNENHKLINDGIVVDNGSLDKAMPKILVEAERVKRALSDKDRAAFRVENVSRTMSGVTLHMICDIDRRMFDELTRDLRERAIEACKSAIAEIRAKDPKFSVRDLHDILLVGGMTRVPAIRNDVAEFFGKTPKRTENPEQVVAMGAAIRAAVLDGRKQDLTIADITSHTLAVETSNGVAAILIPRGTSYPIEEAFTLTNEGEGQEVLSVRLLQGEASKAAACNVIWAADIPAEPGEAQSAREPLVVKIDASGRPSASCGGFSYDGEAA